jgi:hypothetical protein
MSPTREQGRRSRDAPFRTVITPPFGIRKGRRAGGPGGLLRHGDRGLGALKIAATKLLSVLASPAHAMSTHAMRPHHLPAEDLEPPLLGVIEAAIERLRSIR